MIVETPRGVFGNPNAIERCTLVVFAQEECAPETQAGLITVRANYEGSPNYLLGTAPIYDLEPSEEETALFGFIVPTLNIPIQIPVSVRTGSDYGLSFKVSEITQVTPLAGADITIWGFPADNVHETERFPKGTVGRPSGCVGLEGTGCLTSPTPVAVSVHPLIDNPTDCSGQELPTTLKVQTYQDPTHSSEAHSSYQAITGCENEVFKPLLYSKPTSTATDSPSGLDITLQDKQFLDYAASPSEVRDSTVVLPAGLTINPDAADGQTACADAQANFGSEGPASCPDSSKIGTVALHTPALAGPLQGSVYIGEPKPGSQYRLFLVADGFGLHVKLVGSVRPNPQTGQVAVYFEELPQVPFDSFNMHLFSSDRGLMATPTSCTIYRTEASFVPWNRELPVASSSQVFGLTSGPNGSACPGITRPFTPTLAAGTSNPLSGAYSGFSLKLNREDGDQFLGKLNFTMPPGLTGSLKGITYCPEADILAAANTLGRTDQAAPSCPASSEIGTSNVAAGPGSHPFHAVGNIYMAVVRFASQLARGDRAVFGWLDRRACSVRVRLSADAEGRLVYLLEVPERMGELLRIALRAYPGVELRSAEEALGEAEGEPGEEVVRAELVLARPSVEPLARLGLDPDPLSALAATMASLDVGRGERAEVCVDLLSAVGVRRGRLRACLRRQARRLRRREVGSGWWDRLGGERDRPRFGSGGGLRPAPGLQGAGGEAARGRPAL